MKIAKANTAERSAIVESMKFVKKSLAKEEEDLKIVMKEWQLAMLSVPDTTDMSVPEGESDADNKEVKSWGKKKVFDFKPLGHVELMKKLDMADFDRGDEVAGFRGNSEKRWSKIGVCRLELRFEILDDKGFTFMIAPSLVKRENFLGSGYLPQGEEDLYKTQDAEYLAGTAEVPTMGYYADEVLDRKDLPKKSSHFLRVSVVKREVTAKTSAVSSASTNFSNSNKSCSAKRRMKSA